MKKAAMLTALLCGVLGSSDGTKTAQAKDERSYKLNVLRTAYCLRGHTFTGRTVGKGIVAVDPAVIRLHSRMYIPGYGYGIAEDTGSAVRGAHIDVWVSDCHAAMSMTRYVTITVY